MAEQPKRPDLERLSQMIYPEAADVRAVLAYTCALEKTMGIVALIARCGEGMPEDWDSIQQELSHWDVEALKAMWHDDG